MHLNTIIPHTRCFVFLSFLTDGDAHANQIVECELVGAASNIGRPIQFHALLRDGALFANLPIHAFCWKHPSKLPNYTDQPTSVQLWDNPTHTMVCTVYPRLTGMRCKMRALCGEVGGEYRMSFDWMHADVDTVTSHPIEIPNERKCAHLIAGDDGLFYALPNNMIVWEDPSWVIEPAPTKDKYKAITQSYRCEQRFVVENTDAVFYSTSPDSTLDAENMAIGEEFLAGMAAPLFGDPIITIDEEINRIIDNSPANGLDGSDVPSTPEMRITPAKFNELPQCDVLDYQSKDFEPKIWRQYYQFDGNVVIRIGVKHDTGLVEWYDPVLDLTADEIPF